MERREKKSTKMSVPQFGGWEHKHAGVPPTDYSMVFSQARANKKTQKNDLSEVRRLSLGNETGAQNGNQRRGTAHDYGHARGHAHGHGHHGAGPSHGHDSDEDPLQMSRRKSLTNYLTCFKP